MQEEQNDGSKAIQNVIFGTVTRWFGVARRTSRQAFAET
jgi:hypothetical protein